MLDRIAGYRLKIRNGTLDQKNVKQIFIQELFNKKKTHQPSN